jgi:arylsulfatase A-like enzyme
MKYDRDILHRQMYEGVREQHPEIPAWDDLTDEQREKMRKVNEGYTAFMDDLGDSIRKGTA